MSPVSAGGVKFVHVQTCYVTVGAVTIDVVTLQYVLLKTNIALTYLTDPGGLRPPIADRIEASARPAPC